MNGRPWSDADTAALERMRKQGKPLREIAQATGFSIATLKARSSAMGLTGYRGRTGWTRRDWLLHDAAGLDFQIAHCPT